MREILFRGKRLDNSEWVEGFYHFSNWYLPTSMKQVDTTYSIRPIGAGDAYQVDPDTVGQYTGLQDMQDVKIFEGDIVQFGGEYGEIEYSEDEAMFHVVFNGWLTDFDHLRGADVEVIGNIHDNPELLEVNHDR